MFREFRTPFFTVLFILILVYVFARLFGPLPLTVNSITTMKTDMFTASGEGEATTIPDTATFTVGVTKNAPTVETAKDEVNKATNAIIAEMERLGVQKKSIKTTNVSVNPDYDYTNGTQTPKGFTVSQNLEVKTTPIEKANKALDAATAKGANVVSGVSFTVDDSEREKLEAKARSEAIKKAKSKAQSIAQAAGVRLGRIINVQESSTPQQPPILMEGRSAVADKVSEPTQLQPGENTVRVTVTLFYETL